MQERLEDGNWERNEANYFVFVCNKWSPKRKAQMSSEVTISLIGNFTLSCLAYLQQAPCSKQLSYDPATDSKREQIYSKAPPPQLTVVVVF